MAGKKLARHVTVAGTTYGPGDDVPADVMEKITNPKAWEPLTTVEGPTDDGAPKAKAGTSGGARLATAVTVGARTYLPEDHIPDEVAAQIRNPKAWEGGKGPQAKAVTDQSDPDTGDQSPVKEMAARPAKAVPAKAAAKTAAPPAPSPAE